MWTFIKRLFGFGKKLPTNEVDLGTPPTLKPNRAPKAVYKAIYYRRNGNYYLYEDDSLLEDLVMLAILTDMFDESELEYQENNIVVQDIVPEEPETTVQSIDAAVEEIRQETSYTDTSSELETTRERYVSEPSSYDSSSSYDSGSSDSSGGGDD